MKKFLAGLAWLLAFALAGALALDALGFSLLHHLSRAQAAAAARLGGEIGVNFFVLAFCFAALPGARRSAAAARTQFGIVQGLWGMAGFGIVMVAGGMLVVNAVSVDMPVSAARHSKLAISLGSHDVLAAYAIAGETAAGLWILWYFDFLGAARRQDGSPAGLAWRPAPPRAYAVAALSAIAITGIVALMYRLVPPDLAKVENLPMAKLFSGGGPVMIPLLVIVTFVGPAVEEMAFRGAGFAGLATKLGPVWAGIITTLLFMAAHAPEKIYYLPGFLDVGLAATAAVLLRLKYGSIRPGIVLHIVYNTGAMLAAGAMQ